MQSFLMRMLALTVLLTATLTGCEKANKKVTVKGTISHNGKPLTSGILKFVGPEGSYSVASIQPDGTFIVTDVVPGEVKVGVVEEPQSSGSSSGGKSAPPVPPTNPLPAKFQDPEKSGLKYTVNPTDTELVIELK